MNKLELLLVAITKYVFNVSLKLFSYKAKLLKILVLSVSNKILFQDYFAKLINLPVNRKYFQVLLIQIKNI